MSTEQKPKNIRPISRFITTHDPKTGKAIFSNKLPEQPPVKTMADNAQFSLAYTSSHFPAQLSQDRDITEYENHLVQPPGLTISTGTVCRIVDLPPYKESPMHRTVSLDYGVVLEGEVELLLDSGETRLLKRGDVGVQRGTNHVWRNVTGDWARMLYVLSPAEPIEIGELGKLGEDGVDDIGIRRSD